MGGKVKIEILLPNPIEIQILTTVWYHRMSHAVILPLALCPNHAKMLFFKHRLDSENVEN